MKLSRIGPAIASVGKRFATAEVARWARGGAMCVAALLLVAALAPHDVGWRGIGLRAGVFGALAALLPTARRTSAASVIDLSVAIWACLLEIVSGASLNAACLGVAASAAGWSLGRNALALSRLVLSATRSKAAATEAAAVTWFTALQRTPPERFDWSGLERWMREHPSHRDAYERVEAVWFAEPVTEGASGAPQRVRRTFGGFWRVAAATRLGLWLAPTYANRVLVFSAAVVLSAVAIYT